MRVWTAVLASLVCLASSACIEDRLSVDITTQLMPDGTCTRRVEYSLERIDTEKDRRVEIVPADDPLRALHRFPTGESWSVRDDARADLHTVLVEGTLADPQQIEGDYWRSAARRALPARNFVSFAMQTSGAGDGSYDYSETFRDPASPLERMRAFAQGLSKRDGEFAKHFVKALGDSPLSPKQVKHVFRQRLAEPFVHDVAGVASRPVFGPRERKQLEDLWESFDAHAKQLAEALALLAPSVSREKIDAAIEDVQEPIGNALQRELAAVGLPLPGEPAAKVHFRVTLILPGTIVRANTCVQGDTASWEFDEDDLYGRGFEMWARSVTR